MNCMCQNKIEKDDHFDAQCLPYRFLTTLIFPTSMWNFPHEGGHYTLSISKSLFTQKVLSKVFQRNPCLKEIK